MDEQAKKLVVPVLVGLGGAILSGALLGWWAKSAGWGFCALAIAVGLVPGLAMLGFSSVKLSERIGIAIGATMLGLLIFALVSYLPPWRAETAVTDDELDKLCLQVAEMKLCGERNIMGVFDVTDVPPEIAEEAKQHVTTMPHEEKLAICNKTFGKRINSGAKKAGNTDDVLTGVLWVALAVVASASPAVLRDGLVGL